MTYFVWSPQRLAGGSRRPPTVRSQHTCPAGRDGRGPKAPFLRVLLMTNCELKPIEYLKQFWLVGMVMCNIFGCPNNWMFAVSRNKDRETGFPVTEFSHTHREINAQNYIPETISSEGDTHCGGQSIIVWAVHKPEWYLQVTSHGISWHGKNDAAVLSDATHVLQSG